MIAKLTTALYLIVVIATPLRAEEIGRIFYSPEQRKQLDINHLRQSSTDEVIVNGIVQKHGGKRTAWINGVAEVVGRSDERSPASIRVPIPGKSKPIRIKVGQTISLTPSNTD
jgi:hypothetical protein